ncbi:hypothetical protein A2U01_0077222, partial [Trifolium medium]|nr:hypothetical protein [Trifolium medium]
MPPSVERLPEHFVSDTVVPLSAIAKTD